MIEMRIDFKSNERPKVKVWFYDEELGKDIELVGEVCWTDGMFMRVGFTDCSKVIDVREVKYELI